MMPTAPNPEERPSAIVPATERAIESAVDLARAETRLALLHAKALSIRAVKIFATTLLAGFSFQIGIALLVLVPMRGASDSSPAIVVIVCATLLCALVCAAMAVYGLARIERGK